VTYRDPTAAAREMCRSLEAKISAKEEALEVLKIQVARAEEHLDHFLLIRPMGSLAVATMLGFLLGGLTAQFLP